MNDDEAPTAARAEPDLRGRAADAGARCARLLRHRSSSRGGHQDTPPLDLSAPTPPAVYSNWVRPAPGVFDLTLDFGFRAGFDAPEWLARVTLSWEEVRVLDDILRTQISLYEEHVGPIRDVEHTKPEFGPSEDDDDDDEDADADQQ